MMTMTTTTMMMMVMMTRTRKMTTGTEATAMMMMIGTLRSDDVDGNGNPTKAIGLISKTTISHVHHAFLYISLPSLHDYDVKMPNFTMYRGSTQATKKISSLFLNLNMVLRNSTLGGLAYL